MKTTLDKKSTFVYVPVQEVKQHISNLVGIHRLTLNGIARASGVSRTTVGRIMNGRGKKMRSTHADKILSVTASDKSKYGLDQTWINSEKTVKLIEEMHEAGFSYSWLVRQTGYVRFWENRSTHNMVTIRVARRVLALHNKLWMDNTEGFYIIGGGTHYSKTVYTGKTLRDTCNCFKGQTSYDRRHEPKFGNKAYV